MWLFVVAVLLLIGAVAAAGYSRSTPTGDPRRRRQNEADRKVARNIAIAWAVVGMFLMFWTTTTVIEARSIGVKTSFGQYVDTLDNGFHFIAPWQDVETFTTTVQTVPIEGDGAVQVTYSTLSESVDVKADLAGGGKGQFDGNYSWSLNPDGQGTRALWERYREFDRVSNELVAPTIRDSIVKVGSGFSASKAPISQPAISDAVRKDVAAKLAAYGIIVDRVSITSISNDENTQASLDKIVNAQNDIRRAREEQTRARIDAETAKIRTSTGALSPAANQRYCLDIVNNWDQGRNGQLPATFSCSLGAPVSGVIVGGK